MGENREYLTQSASDGSINISEDVVVAIASEAIGEIEGVGAMMTTMTEQLTEQFMGKKPARGIRMDIQDGEITLDVYLTVKYGFAIPETAAKVQDAVMSAVETMTGFSVRAGGPVWERYSGLIRLILELPLFGFFTINLHFLQRPFSDAG